LGIKVESVSSFYEMFGMEKQSPKDNSIKELCSIDLIHKQDILNVIDSSEDDDVRDFCDKLYNVIKV